MDWRTLVIETAWRHPFLWRGLKAAHPRYVAARCRLSVRPRMRWMGFEVTNHCNLACVMCGGQLMTRPRGMMPPAVFEEAIEQVPDGSLACVALHSVGEPTLHPELPRFVRRARPKARDIFLSTNGLALRRDARQMRRLLDAGLTHIHFSAEGYDETTYEPVRVGGDFSEFIENLRLFRRARDASHSAAGIHLQYTLFRPHDRGELRRVREVYGDLVDAIEFRPLNNQSSSVIGYRPEESIAGVRCYDSSPIPCLALWCAVTVLWDGRISLCPRDHTAHAIVGQRGSPLAEAWSGEEARTLRATHAMRAFPDACSECFEPYWRRLDVLELDRRLNAIAAAP